MHNCITIMFVITSTIDRVVEHLPRDVSDQSKGATESESDMTEIALVFNPALVRKLRSLVRASLSLSNSYLYLRFV